MEVSYRATFLDEICGGERGQHPEPAIEVGHKVHVVGVLSDFPCFQRFGVLHLDGRRLLVDFDLVAFDFQLLDYSLYHALGELRPIGEIPNIPTSVQSSSTCGMHMYLKVRFVRAAAGMDIKLYKLSVIQQRKFLKERKSCNAT